MKADPVALNEVLKRRQAQEAARLAAKAKLPGPIGDAALDAALERIQALGQRLGMTLARLAAAKVEPRKCEVHGIPLALHLERSAQATIQSGGTNLVFCWDLCPQCLREGRMEQDAARMRAMGVPDRLAGCAFSNWEVETAQDRDNLEQCAAFAGKPEARGRRNVLLMLGVRGRGKSHLAVSILRVIGTGWFTTWAGMLYQMRRRYDDKTVSDPVARALSARCLVLDELGVSPGARDELATLHMILDHRYGAGSPTVITANLDDAGARELIGERMVDRLRDGLFARLKFSGRSRRK